MSEKGQKDLGIRVRTATAAFGQPATETPRDVQRVSLC
jgi:hypothetical protein